MPLHRVWNIGFRPREYAAIPKFPSEDAANGDASESAQILGDGGGALACHFGLCFHLIRIIPVRIELVNDNMSVKHEMRLSTKRLHPKDRHVHSEHRRSRRSHRFGIVIPVRVLL